MECRKRLNPGMNGTKRYQQRFGERLLFVRYRHDERHQRRVTTVELIVDEKPLPKPNGNDSQTPYSHLNRPVAVRVEYHETQLRTKVKEHGGKWLPEHKRWWMPYSVALELGLENRIDEVSGKAVLPDVETNDQ